MRKEQVKLVNAQSHKYKGTRQNSHVICAQTYTIKLFEFFTFYVILDFLLTQNCNIKVRLKTKQCIQINARCTKCMKI